MTASGRCRGDECERTTADMSKRDPDGVKTGAFLTEPGQAQGKPADCLSGVRHEGGVNPAQALVRNVGTCRLVAKGEIQVEAPRE
jgi:hypothetical protein